MIFGQSVMADQGGHYVPRTKEASGEAYVNSLRVNQHTGLIDPAWVLAAAKQSENNAKDDADYMYWKSMGPDNIGGRTTSVVFSKNYYNRAYIGSMGGGVFYTWNNGISWHQVGENLMVSCMVEGEDGTIYVGTGEVGDAVSYNGMSAYNYSTGFVGSGIYKINPDNNEMTRIESTIPAVENDAVDWAFINDIAVCGDTLIVATPEGLKYTVDEENWFFAKDSLDLTGAAAQVKVNDQNMVVASIDKQLYIGSLNHMVCKSVTGTNDVPNGAIVDIESIGTPAGFLDVTVGPDGLVVAAAIANNGNHTKIYASNDFGKTWRIILPSVTTSQGHLVYEKRGLFNHGLVVDPTNPDHIYVLGYNLWLLEKSDDQTGGYYMAVKLSSASILHVGMNDFVFNPNDLNAGYVATDGGIYKAVRSGDTYFNFTNCNRGYVASRCLNVAPSGKLTRVVAGLLEQGPILIEGMEGTNNMGTADMMLVESGSTIGPAQYSAFEDENEAGSCIVSTFRPNTFFLSTKNATGSTSNAGCYRTETAGADFDFANFTSHATYSAGSLFNSPLLLREKYDDELNPATIWFKNDTAHHIDYHTGDVIQIMSENGMPFDYVFPHNVLSGDSIEVQDPLSARLYRGIKDAIFMTRQALQFSSQTIWWKLVQSNTEGYTSQFSGSPSCIAMDGDGENLFVGTLNGKVFRFMGEGTDNIDSIWYNYNSAGVVTKTNYSHFVSIDLMDLPTTDQVVTSVAIDQNDGNNVVVTLGNYGNESYVLYSTNALSANPTFTEVQGNLPKMPVYSSVIEMTTGHVIIGTERGIYRCTNIGASSPEWALVSDNMGKVPVMELKQQTMDLESQYVSTVIDSVTVVTEYPGVSNRGVIYAATYGRGLFRCETYRLNSGEGVPETPTASVKSNVSMYPNPVRDNARVSFELNDNNMVSYQVYDMSGRMIKTETLGNYTAGKHEVEVNMNGLAKGAYVLRLNAGSQTSSVKFMVF